MKKIFACLLLSAFSVSVMADPFPKGDPKKGEALVKQARCESCHVSMFGGDGSEIYTRDNRIVKTPSKLLAQVRFCSTQAGANWFPEEEEHVAAYLNQRYYKFK